MAQNKNVDGMRYPSVDDLLKKVDSKYKLAYVAAKRAKIIDMEEGWSPLEDSLCAKSLGIALEEVLADKITIDFQPAETIFQSQTAESDDEEENN